jgi:hypothetical protein
MTDRLFLPGLPAGLIEAAYAAAPGNEIKTGKFANPESSSALAANAFGYFLERPQNLPALPRWADIWKPESVTLEAEVRFPWTRGMHPWLDVLIETDTSLIGVESKRYEPFRSPKKAKPWSKTYWHEWDEGLAPFARLRDDFHEGRTSFARLDAPQLIKHAFGLHTQVHRDGSAKGKRPVLIYLYSEPDRWPNGKRIDTSLHTQHRVEIEQFAERISGAGVRFHVCRYGALLDGWSSSSAALREHANAIQNWFYP